ncbi:BZ3500_MvSof-1268-A1-R1_Chr12-3g04027 [Microbotryum saponariae]|uniref:BZ3500_MvSof-1268-A1-R1_Chr12-3g04027 protein n=1 Tax=Microbotryum saponariae TaxID=289078 RepID=A0A2X0LTE3_9BASI|nr:BZ3500_MvSof-1268-A1-R1_Chr12-3g04027 [Microbotryum saponariae]SDA02563.1 BZ3501_MvSof-1269-A2-R1_Chr12-3g03682 [Microbotryum saponariae]
MADASMAPTPRSASKPDTLLHSRIPIDIRSGPWHYVLLEIIPRSSTSSSSAPVDAVTLHQMMLKTMADWYGSVGGSTTKFDVLALSAASTEAGPEKAKGDDVRLGIVRVDTCSAHHLITSIPFASFKKQSSDTDPPSYQVHVLAHSGDFSVIVKRLQRRRQKMPWEKA